ncbi:hypothetical protein Nepgr_018823 [Nepenthes gracilis]|uniref:Uncharacterized protein n=1 Tax=Nepenthes gracilis TaxID=150966 RepID=A0AAD3SUT2_NEPGR|nr:hypothetical protein Nepgr_018823 [Nepenthes gracilis]
MDLRNSPLLPQHAKSPGPAEDMATDRSHPGPQSVCVSSSPIVASVLARLSSGNVQSNLATSVTIDPEDGFEKPSGKSRDVMLGKHRDAPAISQDICKVPRVKRAGPYSEFRGWELPKCCFLALSGLLVFHDMEGWLVYSWVGARLFQTLWSSWVLTWASLEVAALHQESPDETMVLALHHSYSWVRGGCFAPLHLSLKRVLCVYV